MKNVLWFVAGISAGCLLAVVLGMPLFRPLDANTAAVVAALFSTVLAVVGAYALWLHQTKKKQQDLATVVVPIFDPLYIALRQVHQLGNIDRAAELFGEIDLSRLGEVRDKFELIDYRVRTFSPAIDAAVLEAETVLAHWSSIQDLVLSANPEHLPHLLALHRVAKAAVVLLPPVKETVKPIYVEDVWREPSESDMRKLAWGIGSIAKALNAMDHGSRDESGYDALQAGRLAVLSVLK
ncbi:hypothetical protein CSC74_03185 [Pseudoxanthomonas yeongjuensis]|uniref:hypothetical protein n=1 Tax=Pseudoxanthomonas yeongjuensis TaxID=377616 RepID=UPI001391AB34|nr:hypothetical protein [Pseudoxanthomonas yeongjuensis]KAF1717924.1 hypothetical protein CSC74_03185 [Pseudoxanthomonas yeongjuensis]